jgi:hypothetical protein
MIYFGDATVYPPLSAMSESQMKKAISPAVHVVSNSLTVIQFLVTLCLLYVAFKMGMNKLLPVNHHQNNGNGVNTNVIKPKAAPVPTAKPKEEAESSKQKAKS